VDATICSVGLDCSQHYYLKQQRLRYGFLTTKMAKQQQQRVAAAEQMTVDSVLPLGPTSWWVGSRTKERVYSVACSLASLCAFESCAASRSAEPVVCEHSFACSCPDFASRSLACKHVYLVSRWIDLVYAAPVNNLDGSFASRRSLTALVVLPSTSLGLQPPPLRTPSSKLTSALLALLQTRQDPPPTRQAQPHLLVSMLRACQTLPAAR
jgi:hypothetical protein